MLYMFDVDGTLIQSFIREKPQKHGSELEAVVYDKVELMPGRLERVEALTRSDPHACFALVTNQGGVAFGFQTIEQVTAKMARVCDAMQFFFSKPFSVHICFYHPKATVAEWMSDTDRRKPGCGMLDEAMQAHRLVDRATAVYVGDLPTDQQAAEKAGVAYMDAKYFFGQ